jgi:ParB family transcriptional regulator, chromosome partitioning protein
MTKQASPPRVESIPIDLISLVNPRVRNKKIFKEIVANIAELGLKRPVTVARRAGPTGPRYDLVCGQGRLEAYRSLGQLEIPALVIDADAEDCLVMSLVENLARRQHRAIDLLHDIDGLKQRGYQEPEIARKTGLTLEYVRGVLRLLENGEHRLLRAVESGCLPISVAVDIAKTDDVGVQQALQQAYENKLLRGRKLLLVKRLIDQRRRRGKGLRQDRSRGEGMPLSSTALIRAYREDVDRKRIMIRKAEATRDRLIFITQALRALFADEHFVTLLRAEGLETLPKSLADRFETVN